MLKLISTAMSPSPATGLSKGEREREISSTNFGECKDERRTFLCVLLSILCSVCDLGTTLMGGVER